MIVNDIERNKLDVTFPMRGLLSSQIRLGGHQGSQENEQCKAKNLFHGLMKGFVLIFNPPQRVSMQAIG